MLSTFQVILTDITDQIMLPGHGGRYRVMGITYQPQPIYGEVRIANNMSYEEACLLAANLIEIERVMQS